MNVQGASTANSAHVIQWPCDLNANSLWNPIAATVGGYLFQNFNSAKCLDVQGASTANGAKLIQFTCSGASNQAFHFPYNPWPGPGR